MKPKLQDYLLIGGALIAIFVSGHGIGFLFGERRGLEQGSAAQEQASSWEERTMQRLTQRLKLRPDQVKKIEPVIDSMSSDVLGIRKDAIRQSQALLLDVHEEIELHLDENQRDLLKKDKQALENALQ